MSIITQIALYVSSAGLISLLFLLFYQKTDKIEILKFLRRLGLYMLPLIVLVGSLMVGIKLMSKKLNGITMNDQIIMSFDNVLKKTYETIIMGNSRTYRGVNPDMMDSTTYNFSFDNETFFEQYFKLQYLDRSNQLPRLLILGVDYFEFSFLSQAMQASYRPYFGEEYNNLLNQLSRNIGVEFAPIDNVDDWFNSKMSEVFGRSTSQYLSYLWRTLQGSPFEAPCLKANGQYVVRPVPTAVDGEFMTRSSKMEPCQQEKFEQIMAFAKQRQIKVILLMPPCRDIEMDCYTQDVKDNMNIYFKSFERPDSVWYLNMSELENYHVDDYMDGTHLNPIAADKFSRQLYDTIKNFKNDH